MGFFSWKTSDTGEAIRNVHSNGGTREVYMLNPTGANFKENAYGGEGDFGGMDSYVHIHNMNLGENDDMSNDKKRSIGLALDTGDVSFDKKTGKYYSFHCADLFDWIIPYEGNYGTKQPEYGKTPNELHDNGTWEKIPLRDFILKGKTWYPLKFSFDKDAKYDSVDAAETDPNQGFFDD